MPDQFGGVEVGDQFGGIEVDPRGEALKFGIEEPLRGIGRLTGLLQAGAVASSAGRALQEQQDRVSRVFTRRPEPTLQTAPAMPPGIDPGEALRGATRPLGRGLSAAERLTGQILGAYAFEAIGQPELQAQTLGISPEAIRKSGMEPDVREGETDPFETGIRMLPAVPAAVSSGFYGLAKSTPRLAAMAGLEAAGIPAPVAAGTAFGLTDEGFDPKAAAIGAILPSVGKLTGGAIETLATRWGVKSEVAANLINRAGGMAGIVALLTPEQIYEIRNRPPEERKAAIIDAAGNIGFMTALGGIHRGRPKPRDVAARALARATEPTEIGKRQREIIEREAVSGAQLLSPEGIETPDVTRAGVPAGFEVGRGPATPGERPLTAAEMLTRPPQKPPVTPAKRPQRLPQPQPPAPEVPSEGLPRLGQEAAAAAEPKPGEPAPELAGWTDYVDDLKKRGRPGMTLNEVRALYPGLTMSRDTARSLYSDAFGMESILNPPVGERTTDATKEGQQPGSVQPERKGTDEGGVPPEAGPGDRVPPKAPEPPAPEGKGEVPPVEPTRPDTRPTEPKSPDDWANYNRMGDEMQALRLQGGPAAVISPEYQELWRQRELIKNKYDGQVPPKPETVPGATPTGERQGPIRESLVDVPAEKSLDAERNKIVGMLDRLEDDNGKPRRTVSEEDWHKASAEIGKLLGIDDSKLDAGQLVKALHDRLGEIESEKIADVKGIAASQTILQGRESAVQVADAAQRKKIRDSYFANKDNPNKPFKHEGKTYAVTGILGRGKQAVAEAWELVPKSEWKGDTFTKKQLHERWSKNESERGDHTGQLVKVKGKDYVLANKKAFDISEEPLPKPAKVETKPVEAQVADQVENKLQGVEQSNPVPPEIQKLADEASARLKEDKADNAALKGWTTIEDVPGMTPQEMTSWIKENHPNSNINVYNDPARNIFGSIFWDNNGNPLRITINAAKVRTLEQLQWTIEHEFAHAADRMGIAGDALSALSHDEIGWISNSLKGLYGQDKYPAEIGARGLQLLAENWRGRSWFDKVRGTIERWATQLGFKMTRAAAESMAAKAIADTMKKGVGDSELPPEGSIYRPGPDTDFALVQVKRPVAENRYRMMKKLFEISINPELAAKLPDGKVATPLRSFSQARRINAAPERVADYQKLYAQAEKITSFDDLTKWTEKEDKLKKIPVLSLTKGCQRAQVTIERVENGLLPAETRIESCYGGDCWVNETVASLFGNFENMESKDLKITTPEAIAKWMTKPKNVEWLNQGPFIRMGQQGCDSHTIASGLAEAFLKEAGKAGIDKQAIMITAAYAPVTDAQYRALVPYKDKFQLHFSVSGWFHKNELMMRLAEFEAAKKAGLNPIFRVITNKDNISGVSMPNEKWLYGKLQDMGITEKEVLETPYHDDALRRKKDVQHRSQASGEFRNICCETGKCLTCKSCIPKTGKGQDASLTASLVDESVPEGRLGARAEQTLDRLAAEASARIKSRRGKVTFGLGPGGELPNIADYAAIAAAKIAKYGIKSARWVDEMYKEHTQRIKPFIEQIRDAALQLLEQHRVRVREPQTAVQEIINEATGIKPETQFGTIPSLINTLQSRLRTARELKEHFTGAPQVSKAEVKVADDWLEADANQIKTSLTALAKEKLPPAERGRFLTAINNASKRVPILKGDPETMYRRAAKVAAAIDDWSDQVARKRWAGRIQALVSRAIQSPTVDIAYKARIEAIAEGFTYGKLSPGTIAKLERTRDFLQRQKAAGVDVSIPQEILDKVELLGRVPLREMPLDALHALYQKIELLESLGRENVKNRMIAWEQEKSLKNRELVDEKTDPFERRPEMMTQPGEPKSITTKVRNSLTRSLNSAELLDKALLPVDAVFDMIGDGRGEYKGWLFRNVRGPIDLAFNEAQVLRDRYADPIGEMAVKHNLGEQSAERINLYALAQMAGGKERMIAQGILPETIAKALKEISAPELAVYRAMRKAMDEMLPDLQRVMRDLYNIDVKPVENYWPMPRDWSRMEYEPSDPKGPAFGQLMKFDDLAGWKQMLGDFIPPKTSRAERGMTIERQQGAKTPIKTNAFDVFYQHINDAAYLIKMQRDLKMIGEIVRGDLFREKYGDLGQMFTTDWLDTVARQGRIGGFRRWAWLDSLRKRISAGVVGFRVASNLVHLSNIPMAMGRTGGPLNWGRGLKESLTDQGQEFLKRNFAETLARGGGEPALVEAAGLDIGPFADTKAGKKYRDAVRASFYVARQVDRLNSQATVLGIYLRELEKKGLDPSRYAELPVDREAQQLALVLSRRAVASPLPKDVPLALSRGAVTGGNISVARSILQFQNIFLDQWSNLRHDLFKAGIGKRLLGEGDPRYAANMALAITTMLLAESMIRGGVKTGIESAIGYEPKKEREEDYSGVIAKEGTRRFPFGGQLTAAVLYQSSGIPVLDTILRTPVEAYKAFTAKTPEAAQKHTIRAVSGALQLRGVPGASQIGEVIEKGME